MSFSWALMYLWVNVDKCQIRNIVLWVYNSFGDANNKLTIDNPGKPWEHQSPFLPELSCSRNEDFYSWSDKTH